MQLLNQLLHPISAITIDAAISCYSWIGKGNEKAADEAAVMSMRAGLNNLPISGIIAIGEGERDQAPMLHIGEQVGKSGLSVDIAVDPLEGTTLCAQNKGDALSVIAMAHSGTILPAPDLYMQKIAIGLSSHIVDLDETHKNNLHNLARAKKCQIADLRICILNRARHYDMIADIRSIGAKVILIDDGDVLACLKTVVDNGNIDMYIGTGGAPEGIIAAAILKCLGGFMQGRLLFQNADDKNRASNLGITNFDKKYSINEMIQSNPIISISCVTGGFLQGVIHNERGEYIVESMLLSPKRIEYLKTHLIK